MIARSDELSSRGADSASQPSGIIKLPHLLIAREGVRTRLFA